jgi:hypothetical protein
MGNITMEVNIQTPEQITAGLYDVSAPDWAAEAT